MAVALNEETERIAIIIIKNHMHACMHAANSICHADMILICRMVVFYESVHANAQM